jgi:hypothetical protein
LESPPDWVLDEDDMSSDSDTKVPTQQSVKAYVDNNAGGAGGYSGHPLWPEREDDGTEYSHLFTQALGQTTNIYMASNYNNDRNTLAQASPFVFTEDVTVTGATFRLVSEASDSVAESDGISDPQIRIVLHDIVDGLPGTSRIDFGYSPINSNGIYTLAVTPTVVPAGNYYVCIYFDYSGGTSRPRYRGSQAYFHPPFFAYSFSGDSSPGVAGYALRRGNATVGSVEVTAADFVQSTPFDWTTLDSGKGTVPDTHVVSIGIEIEV